MLNIVNALSAAITDSNINTSFILFQLVNGALKTEETWQDTEWC